ncbi:MAG TPA: response regulator [Bacteroidetes bacterium]|nr:response regulator [Bacteroidota bacterium]
MEKQKILIVDDDVNMLAAYKRKLSFSYQIEVAQNGVLGLQVLERKGPFPVVISDFRMPKMDGLAFLSKTKTICPDTVRIMLTGHADLNTAIAAVNDGHVFKLLIKPCAPDTLKHSIEQAIRQFDLVQSERILLEETLKGSIHVLSDLLSLTNPIAFKQASRLKRYVQHMAVVTGLDDIWQFEVAALLSNIGCIALHPEILVNIYAGNLVSEEEKAMYARHPEVGQKLLEKIPRLELVARMIGKQNEKFRDIGSSYKSENEKRVAMGAQLICVARDFDQLIAEGEEKENALEQMKKNQGRYNPELVQALHSFDLEIGDFITRTIEIDELEIDMIIADDIRSKNGLLLVNKGQHVTLPIIERLKSFHRGVGLDNPIRILCTG